MAVLPVANLSAAASAGIGTRLLNASLSGLSTIGKVFDTPGSVLRGVAAAGMTGDPDYLERALHGVYNPAYRISGTELTGGPKDAFTWGGLAAELVLDPVNFVSFGSLGAAGQAAKRLSKLGPKAIAQHAFAEAGSEFAKRRFDDTLSTIDRIRPQAALGNYYGVADSFRKGQRSLLALDVPFTNIHVDIVKAPEFVSKLVDKVSNVSQSVGDTTVAQKLRKAFISTEVDPIKEAIRQELRSEYRGGLRAARIAGETITRQRLLLAAKDPEFDLKVIKLLETAGDELGLTAGSPKAQYMRDLLKTRFNVEELYGKIDNFDETWAFAQELHLLNKQILAMEKATGVPVDEFTDFGYVARVMTNEGRELLKDNKAGRKLVRSYLDKLNAGTVSAFQRSRNVRDLGIDDLNKKLASELGVGKDFKFFDTDLASIQVNRMLGSVRQINRARLAQVTVDLFGKSTKGLDDVAIEKIIRPAGPLVTNMRLMVPYSGVKYADFLSKNNRPFQAVGREGVIIGPYEFANIDPSVLKEIGAFSNKKVFTENGKNDVRVWLDSRWDALVESKHLTKPQQMLLRTFFGQVKTNIIRKNLTEVEALPTGLANEVKAREGFLPAGLYTSSGQPGTPSTIFLGKDATGNTLSGGFKTFLHEFGHALHLSGGMGRKFKDDIEAAYYKARSLYDEKAFDVTGARLVDAKGVKLVYNRLSRVLDKTSPPGGANSQYYARDSAEWFAENFARWMLGERTTDLVLERRLKEAGKYFKDWRDNIIASDFFKADEYGDIGTDLTSLYGDVLKTNAEIINHLPQSSRKRLLTDLLDPVHTRKGYIDIPPDASEGDIAKLFKEQGVDLKAVGKEEADFFERMLSLSQYTLKSDSTFGKLVRVMDEVHALYRTALTQYFPAFHARNAFSGVFMNLMAGVTEPKYYYRAFQQLRSMDPEDAFYLASMGVLDEGKTREVYEFLSQSTGGITGALKSAFVRPVAALGGEGAAQTARNLGQQANQWSRHVGYTIENHARLAHYLAMKERGLSDVEAADSVLKYFFDYGDLTDFEKAVPRRAMLFYTFFRKNLPLMMEQTFTNPRFMQAYARATGQTNVNIPRPEWLPDSFQLSEDEKGNQILLNFGLPPEDLARFDPHGDGLARVFEIAIASMVPTIKEPYQFISGRNAFLGRPMEGGIGERIAAALPTSRVTATGGRLMQAAKGEANTSFGAELGRTVTGINVRGINKEAQSIMVGLEQTRAKLREMVRGGTARKIEIVGERKGMDNPLVGELNSQASKLQDRLRKLDDRKVSPLGSSN